MLSSLCCTALPKLDIIHFFPQCSFQSQIECDNKAAGPCGVCYLLLSIYQKLIYITGKYVKLRFDNCGRSFSFNWLLS